MDNLRILKQAYDDYEAERVMIYDKLNRLLSHPDLTSDPVEKTKQLIGQIANLEARQEVAAGFMRQMTETAEPQQSGEEPEEVEEPEGEEDTGE